MSHFYVSARGTGKTEATRTGTKKTGIQAHVRGWHVGVEVVGTNYRTYEGLTDVFKIFSTGGSAASDGREYLGEVILTKGKIKFVKAKKQ